MPYHLTELGLLVLSAPDRASERIMKAFRESGANIRKAASRLGVTERTLHRHIEKLGLSKQIESMRDRAHKEGWAGVEKAS